MLKTIRTRKHVRRAVIVQFASMREEKSPWFARGSTDDIPLQVLRKLWLRTRGDIA